MNAADGRSTTGKGSPAEWRVRSGDSRPEGDRGKVKFVVHGEQMVEKEVKLSGTSGRVYLPPAWVGSRVKVIRTD